MALSVTWSFRTSKVLCTTLRKRKHALFDGWCSLMRTEEGWLHCSAQDISFLFRSANPSQFSWPFCLDNKFAPGIPAESVQQLCVQWTFSHSFRFVCLIPISLNEVWFVRLFQRQIEKIDPKLRGNGFANSFWTSILIEEPKLELELLQEAKSCWKWLLARFRHFCLTW